MTPTAAPQDVHYGGLCNAQSGGNLRPLHVSFASPNKSNCLGRQIGATVGFTTMDDFSTLSDHVLHIVGLRPQNKMGRVAAKRIVTRMTDNHSIRDCLPIRFNPRGTVCENFNVSGECEAAISALIGRTGPKPTFIFTLWRRAMVKLAFDGTEFWPATAAIPFNINTAFQAISIEKRFSPLPITLYHGADSTT